jgi:hypothetical protein
MRQYKRWLHEAQQRGYHEFDVYVTRRGYFRTGSGVYDTLGDVLHALTAQYGTVKVNIRTPQTREHRTLSEHDTLVMNGATARMPLTDSELAESYGKV